MSTRLRRKKANSVVWGILALVMVGLGGYGVTSFSGGKTELGHVGTRPITVNEYARALQSEIRATSVQFGQQLTFEQAQQMGLDRVVLQQLVTAATLENEANAVGVSVGDAEVRDKLMAAPALQDASGKFSQDLYSQFLQSQRMSAAEFERSLRDEAARTLLQGAVLGGVKAPGDLVDRLTGWDMETRDFTFAELIASDLPAPVAAPTDDEVKAWYDGHGDSYMRPETRQISYIWLKPEDLMDKVAVDEEALKKAYEDRKSEFVIPERRLVARLIYPTAEEAAAAKARFDKGEASFEDLARERGLSIDDVDMGEVAKEDLDTAGDAVFALPEPGVTGPLETNLGPALFAMNGILAAQITSFEDARDDLRSEVAMDRARRAVADRQEAIEDQLASGATLEEVARDEGLEFGQIEVNSETEGGLAAYEAFRQAASQVNTESFPTLVGLEDGGVFAIRLDEIVAPALRPLEEVRDKVIADWTTDQTHAALLALAGEDLAQLQNGVMLEALGLVTTRDDSFGRNDFVPDAVPEVGQAVFQMIAGESRVVEAAGRVFLVTLNAVTPVDPADAAVAAKRAQIEATLDQSLARDVFEQFARTLQANAGLSLNQAAVAAVNAQMQ
ncbi:SurA N-terminal domain-containing protein [Frigidibacter sp. RF13]|uniref:SurA N-terminal domain-containing protein n=1 Tax=Frigidibacter sp. RF13 TaxID=2997340 RepID=UPI00226FDEB2|nr:SurA N-terminal domain-containing protein [Frigidibacter sp. RF13]MCY1125233.1 SurA N-terminal domain-containing protein [Frigidibacter sp. RF13]